MHSSSIINRIALTVVFIFILNQMGEAQIEKIWPTWAQQSSTEEVAIEYMPIASTGYIQKTYNGESNWAMGFYGSNTTLNYVNGLFYGGYFTGSTFYIYVNNAYLTSVSQSFSAGDIITVKCRNSRYSFMRNGVEFHAYYYVGSNPFVYPYVYHGSNVGFEESLSFHREESANVTPTWIAENSWRIGANVLERGQDGGVEMKYDGNTSYAWHLRLQSAKNTNYSSYCIARIYLIPSSRTLVMYYRNPNENYSHQQSNTWSSTTIGLSTTEFVVGATVRIAREGSNIVFYVNGEEKKRVNTDANIDLHPIFYRYYTGAENNVKFTFDTKGGVCNNYFNSKGSTVDANTASTYYPEAAADASLNYVHTKNYDGQGEEVCHLTAEERVYFDSRGRVIHSQTRDMVSRKVWGASTIYDDLGRGAVSTLSAPLSTAYIQYNPYFVLDTGGNPYHHTDFTGSLLNNPNPLGSQTNTLGWWYSTNNNQDTWQATTQYPYSRKEYSAITGEERRITVPGDAMKMGSGRELLSFTMAAGSELEHVFANKHPICRLAGNPKFDTDNSIQNYCNSSSFSPKYIKTITQDADGKQLVVFHTLDGSEVARAVSGNTSSSTTNLKNTTIVVPKGGYQDIHITKRSSSSTLVSFTGGTGKNYSIYNLETDQIVGAPSNGASYSLAEGFYRIVNNDINLPLTVAYSLNYFDFALQIYDLAGRLIATVAPNDVNYNTTNPLHAAYSFFKYNSLEALVWQEIPDAGKTYFYYTRDGKVRFSRNAQQSKGSTYTYAKYDNYSRTVETGQSSTLPPGGLESQVDVSYYPNSGTTEMTSTIYDIPDPGFSVAGYTQTYLEGKPSKIANADENIWYSYDEFGRTDWVARQSIGGPGIKITEYNYDLAGNITTITYQKNQSDEFRHQYAFNRIGALTSVATRQDDLVNSAPFNQARYRYTLDGDLTKKILGDGLETQTFAYTIRGNLKAINPEDMVVTDINGGGRHPFSMALNYYQYDYKAANGQWKETYNLPATSTTSTYNDYTGKITAARWKTRATIGGADYSGHFAYRYRYNYRNELDQAYFANITPYSTSTYEGRATYVSNYYNYLTYDKNGNISKNTRYAANIFACGTSSLTMDNLTYQYTYTDGKNQLAWIDDSYTNNCIPGEITDQNATNYFYNAIGQLIRDVQENIYIEYDLYGRVKRVRDGQTISSPIKAEYTYGPDGMRIQKKVFSGSNWASNWYSYRGRTVQAIYESSNACGGCGIPALAEVPIYGMGGKFGTAYYSGSWDYTYELQDHLGNVRAVIREGNDKELEVLRYADYYPHGWELPGRNGGSQYRYSYQGSFAEKDEETGWNAFDLRSIDPRIGRWMTLDPYEQYYSPYLAMGNDPINTLDPDGGFETLLGAWIYALTHKNSYDPIYNSDGGFWQVGVVNDGELSIVSASKTSFWNEMNTAIKDSDLTFKDVLDYVEHNFGSLADHLDATTMAGVGTLSKFSKGPNRQLLNKKLYDLGTFVRDKTPFGPSVNGKKIRPWKPTDVIKRAESTVSRVGKVTKVVGRAANVLAVGKIVYDVATDNHNTSTWIDAGILVLSIAGGPVGIGIAIGYGLADWYFDINDKIDAKYGYNNKPKGP